MQDMKIEYHDGKLIELSIDNVSFKHATAVSFSHEVGEMLPTITLTLPIGVGDRLVPSGIPHSSLHVIEK